MDFFQQFEKLRLHVPRLALMNFDEERSPYGNFTFKCKDCYFSIGSDFLERCHYNYWAYHNVNCIDCSYCRDCHDCYECIDCKNCYECAYMQDCANCVDCTYCFDCENLSDCFACIGLWRKQYYIYNKPYTKDDYFKTLVRLKKKSPDHLCALFREVKKNRPHVYIHARHTTGLCTGDFIYNSSECGSCFDVERCANSYYLNNALNCTNCIDISFAGEPPVTGCYEIMSGMGLQDSMFCNSCWHGKNIEYSEYCFECEHCFGCIGLRKKKYYIFNISYSPSEYATKIAAIKNAMKEFGSFGQWFPSTYPYEDTKAYELFAK